MTPRVLALLRLLWPLLGGSAPQAAFQSLRPPSAVQAPAPTPAAESPPRTDPLPSFPFEPLRPPVQPPASDPGRPAPVARDFYRDPRASTWDTRALPGVPVTPLLAGSQQMIGGDRWVYRPDGGLWQVDRANGEHYGYFPHRYLLTSPQFPEGLSFENNGVPPAQGPPPFPFILGMSNHANPFGEIFGYPKPKVPPPAAPPASSVRTDESGAIPPAPESPTSSTA